jgi:LuxR family transcriptional regulator, maltose regulon positive regulatory protein
MVGTPSVRRSLLLPLSVKLRALQSAEGEDALQTREASWLRGFGGVELLRGAAPLAEQVLHELPGVAVLVFNQDLRVISAGGDALLSNVGSPDRLVGHDIVDVLAEQPAAAAAGRYREVLGGATLAYAGRSPAGTRQMRLKPLRSAAGEVVAGLALIQTQTAAAADADAPDIVFQPAIARLLAPPAAGRNAVGRRALMLRLAQASEASVVLLTAPAGYGKSTLLSQWAAAESRPFTWVTLDAAHGADVLVDAILAALAAVEPVAEDVAAAIRTVASRADGGGVSVLSDFLAARTRPFVLVLDNAQHLVSPAALRVLGALMHSLPTHAQLVISSRMELDLAYGRLVARRALIRLTARELAMSAAEGAALLAAAGLELSSRQAEVLVRRTAGWPVLLSLVASALQEADQERVDVAAVDGRERIVEQYLRDEFLRPLPRETMHFLLATSVLERMSGPLCDALLEREDSARTLGRLADSNLPLIPLDRKGDWYRYNPFLRDVLQAELARGDARAVGELHRRASDWWQGRGDLGAAVRHARLAGSVARAGELVTRALPEYLLGEHRSIGQLVDDFPRSEIATSPALGAAKAWAALADGRMEASRYWSAVAEGAMQAAEGDGEDVGVRASLRLLRAAIAADGAAAMRRDATAAYELEPPGSPWRPLTCYLAGVGAALTGERSHARLLLREGDQLSAIAAPALRPRILAELALLAHAEDDLDAARELAEAADACAREQGRDDRADTAIVDAVMALTLAREGSEARARERTRAAIEKLDLRTWLPPWHDAQVRLLLAEAKLQLGDAPGARALEKQAAVALRAGARDAASLCERLLSLRATLDAFTNASIPGAGHLTAAELRVLRHLPTHLTFRQIGERLYLSKHTVKTEAISTYRKLGANSRSEAVRRAHELGILT